MKSRWIQLSLLASLVVIAGCATNSELTQKEKDKFAREAEREHQKQAQAQEKMMRQATQGGQRSRDSFGTRR